MDHIGTTDLLGKEKLINFIEKDPLLESFGHLNLVALQSYNLNISEILVHPIKKQPQSNPYAKLRRAAAPLRVQLVNLSKFMLRQLLPFRLNNRS